jgi:hypothetical protein
MDGAVSLQHPHEDRILAAYLSQCQAETDTFNAVALAEQRRSDAEAAAAYATVQG